MHVSICKHPVLWVFFSNFIYYRMHGLFKLNWFFKLTNFLGLYIFLDACGLVMEIISSYLTEDFYYFSPFFRSSLYCH